MILHGMGRLKGTAHMEAPSNRLLPTEVISDAFSYFVCLSFARRHRKKMRACVTQDGTICAKNSAFGFFNGTNPITAEGIQLRSPTPIMTSEATEKNKNLVKIFFGQIISSIERDQNCTKALQNIRILWF